MPRVIWLRCPGCGAEEPLEEADDREFVAATHLCQRSGDGRERGGHAAVRMIQIAPPRQEPARELVGATARSSPGGS